MNKDLQIREVYLGRVTGNIDAGYQLKIPKTEAKKYSLAQLDDYVDLPRGKFPYQPPLKLELEARAIGNDIQGTFGFGFWNDPFSFGFGPAGMSKLLPVLPNVAWFFYGSRQNHLALRNEQPSSGFHVKTFQSPLIPSLFSIFSVPLLPFLFLKPTARLIRKSLRTLIKEEALAINIDMEQWHTYCLKWQTDQVIFMIDDECILKSVLSPKGKLGLVIWMDNQFLRFDQHGYFSMGTLQVNSRQALEVRYIMVNPLEV